MLRENVRLVYQVINDLEYVPESVDTEDLEQIGKIALWKAIQSYDETSQYALSTCCYRTIYKDIIDYLRKHQAKKRKEVMLTKSYEHGFEDELLDSMIINEIRKHLEELDYNIFIDKVVDGLTFDELTEKYGLSKMQLRYRVQKSKQILKKNIVWEC